MKSENYENVIVKKPWGFEYLVTQNESMALWCLHLNQNQNTSMHCHPDKKTGLIVISGEIEVSFLNDQRNYSALSKLMIRPGLFHSSKAVSDGGAILFEFETPVAKENLVRLEDSYGRKEEPYEGEESMKQFEDDCLVFPEIEEEEKEYIVTFHGIELKLIHTRDFASLEQADDTEIFAILDGGLISKTDDVILGPADVVKPEIFRKLSGTFSSPDGITLIRLRKVGE